MITLHVLITGFLNKNVLLPTLKLTEASLPQVVTMMMNKESWKHKLSWTFLGLFYGDKRDFLRLCPGLLDFTGYSIVYAQWDFFGV